MKKVLTILLAGVSTLAFAQKKNDLRKSIDDDGNKLSISVHGTVDGEKINYDRTFHIADLSKEERSEFIDSILGSLGLEKMNATKSPVHFSTDNSDNHLPVMEWVEEDIGHDEVVPCENSKPYGKKVKYNSESGELYLRYQFMKNGEEFIYEKTVDALEKSEKQRQNMILDFEKEIGLPGNLIQ